jgi:diguanylate cyclase (GGDEF)-like protein
MPFAFLIFIGYYFSKSSVLSKAIKKITCALLVFNTIMVVFAIKWPDNFFLKTVPVLIIYFYMALSIYYIISKRKVILRIEYYYILTIAAVYLILEIIRLAINDNHYVWDCNAIILIFMFIVLQQRELYRDTLTGAKNRLALQKCLSTYTGKNSEGFTIIMIDLDYFKNINDSYGHAEGDYILRLFVKLLQRVFVNRGIVVRLGGDEFAVLIDIIDEAEIRTLVSNMERTFEKFNDKGLKPYHIKFSYACGIYKDKNISIDDFINSIDLNMYKAKQSKKGHSKVKRIDL